MVKKMVKYSKFILCIALILSLVAPSYAALSASDGSAFVTKAEFDSALADVNARLTTFEAGINSKIDSQVTSYLDRNGIWNGKKQTSLLDNGAVYNLVDFGTSNFNNSDLYACKNTPITNSSGGTVMEYGWGARLLSKFQSGGSRSVHSGYKFLPTWDYLDREFITTATKSGLLVGTLVERMDGNFENLQRDFAKGQESGALLSKQWSNVFANDGPHTFDRLMYSQPDLGTSGDLNAQGCTLYFTHERGIEGYFNQRADWRIAFVDQDDLIKWSTSSYTFDNTNCTYDASYVNARIDTGYHLYNFLFFVQKDDVLRLRAGFIGSGRGVTAYPFGIVNTGIYSANEYTPDNQLVWWYATKDVAVY